MKSTTHTVDSGASSLFGALRTYSQRGLIPARFAATGAAAAANAPNLPVTLAPAFGSGSFLEVRNEEITSHY